MTGFRVVRLAASFSSEPAPIDMRHYAVPDDGRDLDDITLGELRPIPWMDADAFLDRVCGAHREGE